MEDQSFGRYQKPKGCNIKQVVAGCDGAKLLGRKGMSTRLDERSLPESRKVDSVGEAKSEFSLKEMNEDEDTRIKEKGNEIQKNVVASAVDAGVIMEEIDDVLSYHDENGVPPDSNGDAKIKEEGNEMHKNVVASATNAGLIMEEIYEVQSYHDENGIPPDCNEDTEIKEEGNEIHKNVVANDADVGVKLEEIDEIQSFHDENGVPPRVMKKIFQLLANEEINMGSTTHVDTSDLQSRNKWRDLL
ncbi:unnamed protein product [Vicia faba]|uniref:Uncharacterized protein n=1 Tax=Vicia faba TaxID=3906 RepID=A0AAV1BBD9_VICFA|nr:unnamed protein product [Vicia faba]